MALPQDLTFADHQKFTCYTYKRHGINFVLENLQLYTYSIKFTISHSTILVTNSFVI